MKNDEGIPTVSQRTVKRTEAFHQARWNEPIIFELHSPGEVGIVVNETDRRVVEKAGDALEKIPETMRRPRPPALPELGQRQVLKHYLRLSQETLGADLNVDIGQGTCTMKYNPKIHEELVRDHKLSEIHPLQEDSTIQGSLEIMHKTDLLLREISGLDRFTFQARSGSHAILTMASIVRAHNESKGVEGKDQIITTMFSHPSDAAAAHVLGYEIINLQQNPMTGLPDIEALREAVGPRTAALFITNPEDTGLFNPRIAEFTEAVHAVDGLCCYDQANANGIIGITRAAEANFDMCFFNMHKTFSIPHACGGPAMGAVGVREHLVPFLPRPLVEFDGERYRLNHDMPESIGKVGSFLGVVPAVVRAYAWIMSLGAEGLREVARVAVLNNNYLLHNILKIRGASAPYAEGERRIEQVRYSWQELYEQTGLRTGDVTNRMCDHGMHMWSSHHPFIVPNPMSLEPTESYSKAELDEYIAALQSVSDEAYSDPETVRTAPHRSSVHQVKHDSLDDPDRWAITWRAYLRKKENRGAGEPTTR
jgi:glycine dehydrogenase subunit 2